MREIAVIAIACVLARPALAECSVQPTRIEALAEKLGVFDKDGKYLEEVPKTALDGGASLVSCNENLGLVEVKLASGETKWLDRGELRLTMPDGTAPPKVCVVTAASRASDHTEAAVAGVDPDEGKECVPPQ
jgi:hypothetical protein